MEKYYHELKDLLDEQIKKIVKKGDISTQELDNIYKASAIVLDIETRNAMHKAEEELDAKGSYEAGHSGHYPYHVFYDGTYANGGTNAHDNVDHMGHDGSYRSYMRRNSRAAEKDRMIEQLEEMMESAPDERTKKAIMRCIDKLEE